MMIMGVDPARRSARPRASGPAAGREDAGPLGGDGAGTVEDVGVAVTQRGVAVDGGAVVAATVAELAFAGVADPSVQFDSEGELVVVDVDPDDPGSGDAALPAAGGEAMGAFDPVQVAQLEG